MTPQRLTKLLLVTGILLTLVNLTILITLMSTERASASSQIEPVIRAQKFELVDEQGRVRAELLITTPTTMDGKNYPANALFRLIDENGRPGVKLSTSVDGSGLILAGDSVSREWSGVQLLADSDSSKIILTTRDGQVEQLQP